MDLHQLELFLAVMDTASVTGAATRMHLSPGAVSLQMQNLAANLHTELFVREGKRLRPTAAARRLAEMARDLVAQAQRIQNEFDTCAGEDVRPFHLATGATTLIYRLGQPLRQLRKLHPGAQFHITVCATEEMIAGLLGRQFDLALISLPVDQPQLKFIPLYEEELLFLRPSGTRVQGWHVGQLDPRECDNMPFVLYPKRSNMRTMIDQLFLECGVKPKTVLEAEDTETIKTLVSSGFGWSVLPEFALHRQPRFFQVFRLKARRLARQQALALNRTGFPRPLTESVARFLQQSLQPEVGRPVRSSS